MQNAAPKLSRSDHSAREGQCRAQYHQVAVQGTVPRRSWQSTVPHECRVERSAQEKQCINTVPKKGAVQSTVTHSVSAEHHFPRGSIEHNAPGCCSAEHSAPGGQCRVQCTRGARIMQCPPWVVQSTVPQKWQCRAQCPRGAVQSLVSQGGGSAEQST